MDFYPLWHFMYKRLYPTYKCENCIGMREYGCYCEQQGVYSAVVPGIGPSDTRIRFRKVLDRVRSWIFC